MIKLQFQIGDFLQHFFFGLLMLCLCLLHKMTVSVVAISRVTVSVVVASRVTVSRVTVSVVVASRRAGAY